jgi:hypothetical protein
VVQADMYSAENKYRDYKNKHLNGIASRNQEVL